MGEGIIQLLLLSLIITCVFCGRMVFCMTTCCLYVTAAEPSVIKAMGPFKVLFHQMTHVTCLAYGLYRIAQLVHSNFRNINSLISSVKKIYIYL